MSRLNIEDFAQLQRYLRLNGWIDASETPRFSHLSGGVSNRAVLAQREGGDDWVIKQALSKLRVEADWFCSPQRIEREAAALRTLHELLSRHVPQLVFHDQTQRILAMTAVPQPHANWKAELLAGRTSNALAREFGHLLSRIHNAVLDAPELADAFDERRYFQELRLEPYYLYAGEQVKEARDFLEALVAATLDRRLALTHGDYSPKNVLVRRGRLILLDFEVTHFGDPAFDIGFSLTHFLSKAHFLPSKRNAFLDMARAYWWTYVECIDASLALHMQPHAARHTAACLLARVAGRSPLEYFESAHQVRQKRMALDLMRQEQETVPTLIDAFEALLEQVDGSNR